MLCLVRGHTCYTVQRCSAAPLRYIPLPIPVPPPVITTTFPVTEKIELREKSLVDME